MKRHADVELQDVTPSEGRQNSWMNAGSVIAKFFSASPLREWLFTVRRLVNRWRNRPIVEEPEERSTGIIV